MSKWGLWVALQNTCPWAPSSYVMSLLVSVFDDDDDVVTEAELMSSVQQRDVADVSFDNLQQSGQFITVDC